MEIEAPDKILPNNMEDDELKLLARLEPVQLTELSPDDLRRMKETLDRMGAALGTSGLRPDEYYDHGAEMPTDQKAED